MSDKNGLNCRTCWIFSEATPCANLGVKAVTPDNIMCVHHPEYTKYMNFISLTIHDQLFLFKVNQ